MAGNNPKSPRQKMINLMYIVLTAMLALNVSSDVLNGFKLVEDSLRTSIGNSLIQNDALFAELEEYYQKNKVKAAEFYEGGKQVHSMTDSLYNYIQELKVRIVKEADGKNGDVNNIKNQENTEASNHVMLGAGRGIKEGKRLRLFIEEYKNKIVSMIQDPAKEQIILDNLKTEPSEKARKNNKNWEEAWFEDMPVSAATTLLSKLQSDILYAESEVLHSLVSSIDVGDFRVNQIRAYVIPTSKNVIRGGKYSADIILAAIDSTQLPMIFVNGKELPAASKGLYEAVTGATGNFPVKGYIEIPKRDGSGSSRYDFDESYTVVEPSATVSATMMNVLYAAYDNPIEISVPGVPTQFVSASSSGNGTLTAKGNGQWIAKPAKVGQDFVINVTAQVEGRSQAVANKAFKVRQLPDPTPYIEYADAEGSVKRFKGGTGFSKTALMAADGVKAAIDDGLLNIAFTVVGFETVFHDSMGNAMIEVSNGTSFSERQKNQMRSLSRGKRFYISRVTVVTPGTGEKRVISTIEVIVN